MAANQLNREQLRQQLPTPSQHPHTVWIDGAALTDQTDRTLLHGYTCGGGPDGSRLTHHVYLDDGVIHVHVRTYQGHTVTHVAGVIHTGYLLPDKRLHPESVDIEFATIAAALGVDVPGRCTTFDPARYARIAPFAYHDQLHPSGAHHLTYDDARIISVIDHLGGVMHSDGTVTLGDGQHPMRVTGHERDRLDALMFRHHQLLTIRADKRLTPTSAGRALIEAAGIYTRA